MNLKRWAWARSFHLGAANAVGEIWILLDGDCVSPEAQRSFGRRSDASERIEDGVSAKAEHLDESSRDLRREDGGMFGV
jgi:hypothetical protein